MLLFHFLQPVSTSLFLTIQAQNLHEGNIDSEQIAGRLVLFNLQILNWFLYESYWH